MATDTKPTAYLARWRARVQAFTFRAGDGTLFFRLVVCASLARSPSILAFTPPKIGRLV